MVQWRNGQLGTGEQVAGGPQVDWPQVVARAARRLASRMERARELTPPEVAQTVAAALPNGMGGWLLERLDALGWLASGARLPFDLLDLPACPPEFRGARREVVRLAVFGLPGEGRPDFKHREATYQTICAQIVREASDMAQLATVATRALGHPDVSRDPVLAAMVRSFVAERESALRTVKRVQHPDEAADNTQLRRPFEAARRTELPTRQQLLKAFLSLQREFEVHLAEYNEAAARYAMEKMTDLVRRFPVHIDQASVARHQKEFEDFLDRCALFRQQIEDVAKQAAEAARSGDQGSASWLLRRLRAIHALTPVLLPAERFEALREEIEQNSEKAEHREALRGLIARERDVADQIKKAGAAIYRFHKAAGTVPPGTDAYKRAEAAYRAAVDDVRNLDTEWLTGLLLELETYFEDLNDPEGRAQAQLDRFIGTVRSALTQLRREIRIVQQERAAGGTGATGDSAPSSPA